MRPLTLAAAALGFIGIASVLYGGIVAFQQLRLVDSWPLAEARVINSAIVPASPGQPARAQYEFWYRVADVTRTATWESPGTSSAVRDRVAAHSPGNLIDLHYDPAHPDRVAPNLGRNSATLGLAVGFAGFGLSALLSACALLFLGRRAVPRL